MEQKSSGILYHASCVAGLKELTPRASTHGEAYVYAIDNAVAALLFGAPKDDFDVLMDEEDGRPILWECRPDALRAVYAGRGCALYAVPAEGFLCGQTGWRPERVCKTPVPAIREETIPDLYERLLAAEAEGLCVLHRFRADKSYHAFLCGEFRARIAAFGITENAVRADARFAPFLEELFPQSEAGESTDAGRSASPAKHRAPVVRHPTLR